ncbi:histidine ammonia-lyase [Natranaerobius thermophilus]|uniref:Histidine ammonia-lyase n=1 Tax=Natranaerobius thermophilus (strain ATCC BAA-1301 / DSM 18059 / JW/NM-WN-LF) TaxID=457570 RepID=HUTH_NATTJ|nr:histidine ammonia-lyase [Natranaerobius thermophilus]B2A3D9.1 RecName: Full=Histidine ammonia-lyase; Short=Histidase [Natranaerobius thermophilus JW/NM-WN-LF]ACB86368.1 histidine ammonia-lyase [Natranaerobius thermophilus JW/NM-WN-LF]
MIHLTGENLKFKEIEKVINHGEQVELSTQAKENIIASRRLIDDLTEKESIVYGVTTGFGKFSDTFISSENLQQLQENLILSHSAGVGEPFSEQVVRGMMLFRANSLAKGHSGIRLETVQLLIDMLNKGVHPIIPSKGSLGASGDLAPLAHMVLVMIGKGEAYYHGDRMAGDKALSEAGLSPVKLGAKEGLALINGTQAIVSVGTLTWLRMKNLLKTADICAAMTIDSLEGILDAFQDKIFRLRPHPGHGKTAENIRRLLQDSEIIENREHKRVQDAYTLRCIPQIHGASKDAHEHIGGILNREINSTTDNPLIFPQENEVISGGNFHGQPLALPMDYMSMAIAELANVAERRIERLVNPNLNFGLPPFLIKDGGVSSGFMIAQYTAASLVSENKSLAHPASVDSIPSSANQEDHVSMGTIGARKALSILENTEKVLAIELLCASQALDYRQPRQSGSGTRKAYELVREQVPHLAEDRELASDIETVEQLIVEGRLVSELEKTIGELK